MKTCLAETPVMLCFDFALFVFFFKSRTECAGSIKGKKVFQIRGRGEGGGEGGGGRER